MRNQRCDVLLVTVPALRHCCHLVTAKLEDRL